MIVLTMAASAQERRTDLPSTGKQLFEFYCAVCHGADGTGHGPAAVSLRTPPGDLTRLQKKNGGVYPAERVTETIRGYVTVTAHGSREMPVWGDLFRKMKRGRGDNAEQRVHALTDYIRSMQQ